MQSITPGADLIRTAGGRAMDYAQIERKLGERTTAVERVAHERIPTALDIDAPAGRD